MQSLEGLFVRAMGESQGALRALKGERNIKERLALINRVQQSANRADNVVQVLFHNQERHHGRLLQMHAQVQHYYQTLNTNGWLNNQVLQMRYLQHSDTLDHWDSAFLDRLELDLGQQTQETADEHIINHYIQETNYQDALSIMEQLAKLRQQQAKNKGNTCYAQMKMESTKFYKNCNLDALEEFMLNEIERERRREEHVPIQKAGLTMTEMLEILNGQLQGYQLCLEKEALESTFQEFSQVLIDQEVPIHHRVSLRDSNGRVMGLALLRLEGQSSQQLYLQPSSLDRPCVTMISIAGCKKSVLPERACQHVLHELGHFLHSCLSTHKYDYFTNDYPLDYAEMVAVRCESLLSPERSPLLDQLCLALVDLRIHRGQGVALTLGRTLPLCYSQSQVEAVQRKVVLGNGHFVHYPGVYFVYPLAYLLSRQDLPLTPLLKIGLR